MVEVLARHLTFPWSASSARNYSEDMYPSGFVKKDTLMASFLRSARPVTIEIVKTKKHSEGKTRLEH